MKRLSGIILTVALTLFVIGQVSAQSTTATPAGDQETKQNCGKFVDENKDGVCDNHAAKCNDGKSANFVDANGDGICDHHADGTACKGNGNCCKQDGQDKQNCCNGPKHCEGSGKGTGDQHRHGCENQCPGHKSPDKK
jgi:hypothetical protein